MNDDRERAEAEDRKFRAEIEELVKLEADYDEAEEALDEATKRFDEAHEYFWKCAAAKSKLRMLRRDYPGYFEQPAEGSGQPAEEETAGDVKLDMPSGEVVDGIEVEIEKPGESTAGQASSGTPEQLGG